MIKDKIKKDLKEVIKKTFRKCDFRKLVEEIYLEHPENPEHGDYASNFAMKDFQKFKTKEIKTPLSLAQKIVENFPQKDYLEKVEVLEPGFINFHLSPSFLLNGLKKKLERGFEPQPPKKKKKIVIEFGQPNTHKLPHVGHFRSYAIGESLARLLEQKGHRVFRANYQGDIGLSVAKCLWGWKEEGFKDSDQLAQNIKNLQKAYVFGSRMYEQKEKARKEIEALNVKIYEKDEGIASLWEKTRGWSLSYYHKMNERLGTHYHKEYFESQAACRGKRIVKEYTGSVFEKSEGAVIFPGEEYGLHTRVFLTSKDLPTYEAKDLALIFLKKEDFDYDLSLISTAAAQIEYFKVVYKAAEKIAPDLAKRFVHIPFGLVSLTGAKLSSRKGSIISIDEVLEKTKGSLLKLMEEKGYSQKRIEKIIDRLVVGAAKYSVLKHTPKKNMIFDIKESVALEGNSGPYLQYTHARARSILRKAGGQELGFKSPSLGREESEILKSFHRFPEVVEAASGDYNPSLVCNYLFHLAQEFNAFYEKMPVLEARTEEKRALRLSLVEATARIIKKGLELLGISAPKRM